MTRIRKLGIILLAVLLIFCCACGAEKGRTEHFDGYTIRTEKTRTDEDEPDALPIERSVNEADVADYILNKSSMKFHDPSCPGAAEIKDKNRWEYRGTRQSVLDMGYEPCKNCNP